LRFINAGSTDRPYPAATKIGQMRVLPDRKTAGYT